MLWRKVNTRREERKDLDLKTKKWTELKKCIKQVVSGRFGVTTEYLQQYRYTN